VAGTPDGIGLGNCEGGKLMKGGTVFSTVGAGEIVGAGELVGAGVTTVCGFTIPASVKSSPRFLKSSLTVSKLSVMKVVNAAGKALTSVTLDFQVQKKKRSS